MPLIPAISPQAISAGMSGMKIAEIFRIARMVRPSEGDRAVALMDAPRAASSSGDAPGPPAAAGGAAARRASRSTATRSTRPGPSTICRFEPAAMAATTPSVALRSSSAKGESDRTSTRRRVMQFSTSAMFAEPPTASRICWASCCIARYVVRVVRLGFAQPTCARAAEVRGAVSLWLCARRRQAY
jgi:hypothetical protein